MAFTVEDGTVVAGANSLTTVDHADEFHALRQNTIWAGLDQATKEAKLIEASSFFAAAYSRRLYGKRKTPNQVFFYPAEDAFYNDTPRTSEYQIADNIVPLEVQDSVAQLALIANSQPLTQNVASANAGQAQTLSRRRLGSLEISTGYAQTSQSTAVSNPYPAVVSLLNRLLKPRSNRVIR